MFCVSKNRNIYDIIPKYVFTVKYFCSNFYVVLPSTLTSISSSRPSSWFMVNELGKCTAPGPPNDTCGPVDPPLI